MQNVEQKTKDIKIPINWSHEFHFVYLCVSLCVRVCAMYYLNRPFLFLILSQSHSVHTIQNHHIACNAKQSNDTTQSAHQNQLEREEHLPGIIINSVAYFFLRSLFFCGPNRVEKMLSHFTLPFYFILCCFLFLSLSFVCPSVLLRFSSFISIRYSFSFAIFLPFAHLTQ